VSADDRHAFPDPEVAAHIRMTRRNLLRLTVAGAAAAGVGTVLSACGVSSSPSPTAGGSGSGGKPSFAAGTTINADYMKSGTYDKAAEAIAPVFEQVTGGNIKISTNAWADLNKQNVTDLVTGTGQFDVMSGEWWIVDGFPYLLPLDDYVKRDNFGGDYIPNLFQPGPSNFYQGKRIGVPFSADCITVIYNSELFKNAGVEPKWDNWDDFIATMDSLKGKLPSGVYPHVFQFGAPEQPGSLFLAAYGGTLIASDNTYKVERDKALRALDVIKRLVDYGPPNAKSLSIDEATAVFLQGNAAALLSWPSFVRTVADDPSQSKVVGKWAVGSLPGPGFPLLSCWNHFISKQSKNPDLAWEWIKTYSNVDNGTEFMLKYGVGSPYDATYTGPEASKHAYDWPQCGKNLARAKPVPYSNDVWQLLYNNIGDFLTGSATADEVIDRWHAGWAKYEVPPSLIESAVGQGLKAS
jgi:multiple sugar transport system substrate-binding protein